MDESSHLAAFKRLEDGKIILVFAIFGPYRKLELGTREWDQIVGFFKWPCRKQILKPKLSSFSCSVALLFQYIYYLYYMLFYLLDYGVFMC